jgi:hypothetical protein
VVERGSLLVFREGGTLAETYASSQFVDPAHLHLGRKSGLSMRAGPEGAEVLAFEHGPAYDILGEAVRMAGLPEEERIHARNPFRGWLGWLRRP